MARHRRQRLRRKAVLFASGGVAVGAFLVIAGLGLWTLVVPGAAAWLCDAGLELGGASATTAPSPSYDEQAVLFDPSSTTAISADANVSNDTDSNGYGAAFLVNALSTTGYWYQVGIAFDWGWESGYLPGFVFVYSMYAPGEGTNSPSVFCMEQVAAPSGDSVALRIGLQGATVVLSLSEPAGSLVDSVLLSAYGASAFVGAPGASASGFFTGWMTEWRHSEAYYGPSAHASYLLSSTSTMADFGIGEYDASTGQTIFGQESQQSLACGCQQSFSYEGVTETASPSEFTTG
jgi:hypothetical protein